MRDWLVLLFLLIVGCGAPVEAQLTTVVATVEVPATLTSLESDFGGVVETLASDLSITLPPSTATVHNLATPTTIPSTAIPEDDEPAGDLAQQELIFDEVVHLVRDFYRDENYNGVDWVGLSAQYRTQLAAGLSETAFYQLLTDLVRELDDGHTFVMSPADVVGSEAIRRGDAGNAGLGITTLPRPEFGDALVAWAVDDNAAWNAGIHTRDAIVRVNGELLCCDQQGELNDYLLRGADGDTSEMVVRSPDGAERTVVVTYRPIQVQNSVVSTRSDDIGIITLNSFLPRRVHEEFTEAWQTLNAAQDLQGLIVDVRPNTGGSEREMQQSAELFSDGVVGHFVSRYSELPFTLTGHDVAGSQSIPLVILIGEATNSNGEIFAGLLQEAGRATLVGQPTNGNIETILPYELDDGGQLWLAKDRFFPPSGTNWDGSGVQPDIFVDQAWSASSTENDQTLQTALDYLKSR